MRRVTLLLLAGTLAACSSAVPPIGARVKASHTERTPTSTTRLGPGEPPLMFGVVTSGQPPHEVWELVALSSATGSLVRTVARSQPGLDGMQPGTISELALSPDRNTVYFDYAVGGSCAGQVVSVPTAGGPITNLDPGAIAKAPADNTGYAGGAPAVSPDGSTVAWIRQVCHPTTPPPGGYDSVMLSSVATHSGHALAISEPAGVPQSWDGSGDELMLGNSSSEVETIYRLSANGTAQLSNTVRAPDRGCALEQASFVPRTSFIAAVENCLHPNLYGGNRLIEIDPRSDSVVERLVTLAPDRQVDSFSFDRSGQWLLYQSGPGSETPRGQKTLFVVHGGITTQLASAVQAYDVLW